MYESEIEIFWTNNDVLDKNCQFYFQQSEIDYKVHIGGIFAQNQIDARVANNGIQFSQQSQFKN